MSQIQTLVSGTGKSMLLHESYVYSRKRSTATKLIFRRRNLDCEGKLNLLINIFHQEKLINSARCHTNLSMDTFLSPPTAHCHAPNPDVVPAI